MRLPPLALALPCIALALVACDRPVPATPEAGYRAFAQALRKGDPRAAWTHLSKSTQQLMEARSRAISEASRGAIKDEPALMLLQTGVRHAPVGEVKQRSLQGDAAELEVSGVDGPQRVTLVREGGHWVVDLSATLQAKP